MMKDFTRLLLPDLGRERTDRVMEFAWNRLEQLLTAHAGESRALRTHTEGSLYPAISVYEALQADGMAREEALELLDRLCSRRAEKQARMIRMSLKLPGLYRKMPAIFRWMTVHNFGEAAGFQAHFYETDKTRCKFDMTHCVYHTVCTENGCPELTKCFCHTDDVTNGNMHPKIRWHRTKTIGEGADICDFEIIVEK